MADPVTNFGITTVTVAPSPATTGTTLTPDDATLFPDPAVDGSFNLVVWPTASQPLSTNAEIIRVTALAAGEWTITREQEGTTARTIVAGDQVMLGPTAKTITDLDLTLVTGYSATQEGRFLKGDPVETTGVRWSSNIHGFTDMGTGSTGANLELDDAETSGGDANLRGGAGGAGEQGGNAHLRGGSGDDSDTDGADVHCKPGAVGSNGKLSVKTSGSFGSGAQVLASDDDGDVVWTTQIVRLGSAPPSGAPGQGELPFAYDDTAVTGGFYFWDNTGETWVKVADIL